MALGSLSLWSTVKIDDGAPIADVRNASMAGCLFAMRGFSSAMHALRYAT